MSVISDLLVHRCDRIRYDVVPDAEYGKTNSEVVILGDVACWFQPRSSTKRRLPSQWAMECSHVVYFDGVFPLDVQDKLAWRASPDSGNTTGADRIFEVVGMRQPGELGEYSVVGVNEFDPYAAADPIEG